MDKDINDAFEDLLFCEERITQSAYEEGIEKGKQEGNVEGYHLGYHRGAEIGAELGYYFGIILFHLSKDELKSKKVYQQLQKLKDIIENFPKTNDENFDILGKMDEIRVKYKLICSLLKINTQFPEADKLNF